MSNYRVIVCGVRPGKTIDEVVDALSRVSMKPPATLRALLDGRRVIVKRTTEVSKAAKYRLAFTKLGCICSIEADGETPAPTNAVTAAITMNVTSTVDQRWRPLSAVRDFQYAQVPKLGLTGVARVLRLRECLLAGLLLFLVYHGYRNFLG
jgi:hypothetical protein